MRRTLCVWGGGGGVEFGTFFVVPQSSVLFVDVSSLSMTRVAMFGASNEVRPSSSVVTFRVCWRDSLRSLSEQIKRSDADRGARALQLQCFY